MISRPGAGDRRLTLPALEVLAAQDWPGNHGELEYVLKQMLAIHTTGDLSVHDVPARYRTTKNTTSLSPLEQAERNAIIDALAVCRGNKVHTAQRLSISRSKLYSRMRALGIR
ncbi:helix-turn-helix domain-containing protein [Rhodococcus opacus]|uniref:helix-turn-helix domain-containing protein n=1 Tax=Rhodococcus opacus TaxID=37919 RepID=UPI00146C2413|nr:helix-turn-helix domain-containing protein [Rhodococcus opacus]MDV7088973.1 helix-turn-helix domain-containing protein [Rhodococcus opacus]WKN60259.1 helix-turn-helix domain-containing protein [Rhodococcus opacus]